MSKRIKLSEKYGVNPTIPVCFWCGESKNEIALLGRLGDARKGEDIEAPKNMVLDYEPCDKCKENMALGVTLMEVQNEPLHEKQPEIQKDLYPTSRWCVITREAADRIFGDQLEGQDKVFVDEELFNRFIGNKTPEEN